MPQLGTMRSLRLATLCCLSFGTGASRLAGQAAPVCAAGVVAEVQVTNHSIYSPQTLDGRSFAWAYRLLNSLHVATREDLIVEEILLRAGECMNPALIGESARLLRELPFIAGADVSAERLDPGSWRIVVETWDEWTTSAGLNISIEDEVRFEGAFLSERNMLGRGLAATFLWHRFQERRDLGLTLSSTRALGSRVDWRVAGGRTRTGVFFTPTISYPFVGEGGTRSFDIEANLRDRNWAYSTDQPDGFSHVLLPLENRGFTVSATHRQGYPGTLTSFGGEIEVLRRRVDGPPTTALRNNFDVLDPAPDSMVTRLAGQASPPSHVRFGLTVGRRRMGYEFRSGLDLVSGAQNVALGSELMFTLGRSIATWGTSALDTYARVEGFVGAASPRVLLQASIKAEGRLLDDATGTVARSRDVLAETDIRAYVHMATRHTLHALVAYKAGWRTDQPFQLRLGGAPRVRAYLDYELPAGSTLILRLEERWNPGWLSPAIDLGFTLFGDFGRGWAGDAPFGVNHGWRSAIGGGIRTGFPAGTGSNMHIEMAWPLADEGRGSVLRAYWAHPLTSR